MSIESLYQLLMSLGWALIHSLWMGALLALAAVLFLSIARTSNAKLHYTVLLFLLLIFTGSVLTGLFWNPLEEMYGGIQMVLTETHERTVLIAKEILSANSWSHSLISTISWLLPILSIGWIVVLIIKTIKLFGDYRHTILVKKHSSVIKLNEELTQFVARSAAIFQTGSVEIRESHLIDSPRMFGFRSPVIVAPRGYFTELNEEQLKAILLHELAHASRKDYRVNLVQKILNAIFFFNPFFLWVSKLAEEEREYCCDDLAIRELRNKEMYATTLVTVYERSFQQRKGVSLNFITNNDIVNRVKRIVLGQANVFSIVQAIFLFVTGVLAVLLLLSFPNSPKSYAVKAYSVGDVAQSTSRLQYAPAPSDAIARVKRSSWLYLDDSDILANTFDSEQELAFLSNFYSFLLAEQPIAAKGNCQILLTRQQLLVNGKKQSEKSHQDAASKFLRYGVRSIEYYGNPASHHFSK